MPPGASPEVRCRGARSLAPTGDTKFPVPLEQGVVDVFPPVIGKVREQRVRIGNDVVHIAVNQFRDIPGWRLRLSAAWIGG